MISRPDLSTKLALDVKDLGQLRQGARANSPEAVKGTAVQFEALFVNMMMKSMRDAIPVDAGTDDAHTKTFTSMLDQQLSQTIAKRGMGLADVLVRQMSFQANNARALAISDEVPGAPNADLRPGQLPGQLFGQIPGQMSAQLLGQLPGMRAGTSADTARAAGTAGTAGTENGLGAMRTPRALDSLPTLNTAPRSVPSQSPHVRAFQEKLGAHAAEASRTTGIPAKFMLGQAALESGWGRREIKHADGSASHNLFGIKAGPGWTGKTVSAITTEFVNGVAQTKRETFRAYDTYADSFRDYARLITENKRYDKVLASAHDASGFAQGLQKAGYATDPLYAAKLTRIIKQSLLG